METIVWYDTLGMKDINRVGGKNASLGEMITAFNNVDVRVPNGFAVTTDGFRDFMSHHRLAEPINALLALVVVDDVAGLAKIGSQIRHMVLQAPLPRSLQTAITTGYQQLCLEQSQTNNGTVAVAVRSSATAEDSPEASFAGQQETFLNVRGAAAVVSAVHQVFASLFNDRAIAYRIHQGFANDVLAISVGVQRMVRSDQAVSGVMFTLDTESGFDKVVFITSSYGLGEMIVQGQVNPDEFYVFKTTLDSGAQAVLRRQLGSKALRMVYADGPQQRVRVEDTPLDLRYQFSLNDAEVETLARYGLAIESHYQCAMDIEWAKDVDDGQIYIVQARPETGQSRQCGPVMERYELTKHSTVLAKGRSIGARIGAGNTRIVDCLEQMDSVHDGDVLVTDMTDPDWEPVMKRAAAIVTNRGGRTCHAAIIARELGIPAVVGTNDATRTLLSQESVTVSCAEGDTGYIYAGVLPFEHYQLTIHNAPPLPLKIGMIVGNPNRAFDFCQLPNDGVGLARLEFIIGSEIGIHPQAILGYAELPKDIQHLIDERTRGYTDPVTFYVNKLTEGIATIAAAFFPRPVIVRLSDFKSDEYAKLLGGSLYEPSEHNPMLGFRGVSRYIADSFRDCFRMECRALRQVREQMQLTNVEIMVPFVRTLSEADAVIALLANEGLERGKQGLRILMMCEVPSNALLADDFLQRFDGFSIGSNDLTQMTLGLDRNSNLIAHLFDERDQAVTVLLERAIAACHRAKKYVGICGQGPSDHPEFSRWLMEHEITNISLNPDAVMSTWRYLAGENR